MSSNYCFNVTIYRDGLSTPWGFRLEGGKDYQSPLTIQRVFQGSPASGYLQRGDIILNIQNREATHLFHQEANELIRKAGGSLQLTIKRGQPYPGSDGAAYHSSHSHNKSAIHQHQYAPVSHYETAISHSEYDHANAKNYDPADPLSSLVRNRNIERIRDPKPVLSQTGSPVLPGATPSVSLRSPTHPRRYQQSKTLPISILDTVKSPTKTTLPPFQEKEMIDKIQNSLQKITIKPRQASIVANPYPSSPNIYTQVVYDRDPEEYSSMHVIDKIAQFQPPSPPQQHKYRNQVNKRQSMYSTTSYHKPVAYDDRAYVPPWMGTLKSGSGSSYASVSAIKHQQPHTFEQYKQPIQDQNFSKHEAIEFGNVGPLKITNNQYNTPIGLYSNKNINEELSKQISGSPTRHHPGFELPASDF